MNTIADGTCLRDLHYLLEFLAAWEKRPECLTPMAYQWSCAVPEPAERLEWNNFTLRREILLQLRPRLQYPDQFSGTPGGIQFAEEEFSEVGHRCNSLRLDDTSHRACGRPQNPISDRYVNLLPTTLEIGFRRVTPGRDQPALRLDHTPHHNRMFETAFSSDDDEVVADAVSVWIVDGDWAPPGSFVRYLTKRVEKATPFAPILRRPSILVIERIWRNELEASGLETVRLLNRLDVDVDDMVERDVWVELLVRAICLPAGLETLSSHYWSLLDKLASGPDFRWIPGSCNIEVMGALEKAEGWEKLEVWLVVVWQSLAYPTPTSITEDVGQVTLKLLLQRASALSRFRHLQVDGNLYYPHVVELRRICDQAQMEQLSSEPPPSPYVFFYPAQHLAILISPFLCLSPPTRAQQLVSLPFGGDDTF